MTLKLRNGFRLWDPIDKKIKIARNVTFDENKFIYKSTEVEIIDDGSELGEVHEDDMLQSNLNESLGETRTLCKSSKSKKFPVRLNDL